jgi:hypothetical protein
LPPLPLDPPAPLVVVPTLVAAPPEPADEVVVALPAAPEAPLVTLVLAAPTGPLEDASLLEQPIAATHKRAAPPKPRNTHTPGPGRQHVMVK